MVEEEIESSRESPKKGGKISRPKQEIMLIKRK